MYQQFIKGEWVIDRYYKNGDDQTNWYTTAYDNYRIEFYENGDFTETYTYIFVHWTNTGSWAIERKSNGNLGEFQLVLTFDDGPVTPYDIKEITQEKIDISRVDGEDTVRFIYERAPDA